MFFIHIPKTGGSYVEEIALKDFIVDISPPAASGVLATLGYMIKRIQAMVYYPPGKVYHASHAVCTRTLPDGGWYPRAWNNTCVHLPEFKGSLTFAIVRNPFDLLVSMYTYGFPYRRPRPTKPTPVLDRYGFPFNTFDAYARAFCDHAYPWIIKAQQRFLFFQIFGDDGTCCARYVIKNEYLDEGLKYLCEPMGFVPCSSGIRPKDSRGLENRDYRKFYTPELKALVEVKCARELESFGYSFDGDDGRVIIDTSGIRYNPHSDEYALLEKSG